ncbi:MAG: hypothetical protein A2136_04025 [Chloroflexi bacterium RBG_16_54_11]|nr:MAG: hypothetical protein A2136_04025 [Chloroflexi bacterium RBG_16_54_11]
MMIGDELNLHKYYKFDKIEFGYEGLITSARQLHLPACATVTNPAPLPTSPLPENIKDEKFRNGNVGGVEDSFPD